MFRFAKKTIKLGDFFVLFLSASSEMKNNENVQSFENAAYSHDIAHVVCQYGPADISTDKHEEDCKKDRKNPSYEYDIDIHMRDSTCTFQCIPVPNLVLQYSVLVLQWVLVPKTSLL
jgi:hypothetical protein